LKKRIPILYFIVAFVLAIGFKSVFVKQPNSETVPLSSKAEVIEVEASVPQLVNYNFDVKPILSDKCYVCHGPDPNAVKADFRLDITKDWYRVSAEDPQKQIIFPADLSKSELVDRIRSTRSSHQMPPPESNLELSEKEKQILERWIEQGAKWSTHWAYMEYQFDRSFRWASNGKKRFKALS
jgi:uncharacterized membrane protein